MSTNPLLASVSREVLEAFIEDWVEGREICGCLGCEYESDTKKLRGDYSSCNIPDTHKSERPCEIGWLKWAIEEGEWRLRGAFDVVICGQCGMLAFRMKDYPIIAYKCAHCHGVSCDRQHYHKPDGGWFFAAWEQEFGAAYPERIEGYERTTEEETT